MGNTSPTVNESDIFDRCYRYSRPSEFRALGLYPYFTEFRGYVGDDEPVVRTRDGCLLMFGSNNYLGLTTHPRVKEAAIDALRTYGTGCSGSRMLNGTLDLHVQLEEELADFTGKEAALLFSTGFMTNGCLTSFLDGDVAIYLDRAVHASIVYGTMSTLGKSLRRFRHNDPVALERLLAADGAKGGKMVVVDGVFSMEGDLAPLPELVRICRQYNARLYVDDAHGAGVLGAGGGGTPEHFGLMDEVDIVMSTFSKSFASTGGYIASEKAVIDYVRHQSLPFIYAASMPPASVAAARAALAIIRSEPERRARLLQLAGRIRAGLTGMGFTVLEGITPVIPVIIDEELVVCRFHKALVEAGIYTNPIFRPAAERSMIRISCMATHTDEQVDQLLNVMLNMGRQFQLID